MSRRDLKRMIQELHEARQATLGDEGGAKRRGEAIAYLDGLRERRLARGEESPSGPQTPKEERKAAWEELWALVEREKGGGGGR
jgi:hypothetical protein